MTGTLHPGVHVVLKPWAHRRGWEFLGVIETVEGDLVAVRWCRPAPDPLPRPLTFRFRDELEILETRAEG